MKFQRCPICEGIGTVQNYFTHTTGAFTNICPKCNGEMVIKEPEDDRIPESATLTFYKDLTIGFAIAFFGVIITMLILDHLGIMCN